MITRQKLIKVGSNSLMVIVPAKICEAMNWKEGDSLMVDFIKKVEVEKK